MATEKLLKAVITGPADKLDDAIKALVIDRQFHPTNASSVLKFLGKLKTPDEPNPYRGHLETAVSLLDKLNIVPEFREFQNKGHTIEAVSDYLHGLSGSCSRIITHKNAAESLAEDNELLIKRLMPFSELGVDIGDLLAVKRLELRVGKTKSGDFRKVVDYAEANDAVFLFRSGAVDEYIHCIYLVFPEAADCVAEHLEGLGFLYAEELDETGLSGIPGDRIKALGQEAEMAKRTAEENKAELAEITKREQETFLEQYSWLLYMSSAYDLRASAVLKFGRFHITGWLPKKEAEKFQKEAESLGVECLVEEPCAADEGHIPVKLKGSFVSRIFSPFIDMYGYPAYGEMDPRLFVAISYTLMFGMMFGDVGQGAILILLGIFLAKKKKSWLGGVLACVGCSAIVFGFIYGSVFGNEELIHGYLHVLEDDIMTILIISVGVGIVLIVTCMIQNIITGIRQCDPKKAYFSANGVAGTVLFVAIVVGAVAPMLINVTLFSTAYILVLIVLPTILIFCAEPLSKLVKGQKNWQPESWGMFFIEGFFDLFEMCLSYFSNVVSFLRVGAYAICHAGMMMVVYLLSANADGGYAIWGLIVGNALVMVIEAALVFIQVLRLEFYEMFGRFYTGMGSPFTPVKVDYATAGNKS